VSRHVWEKLEELKSHLPPGIEIVKNFDTADFINRAIGDVWENLLWGGLLAIIVLFMFMRHVRPVLIIGIAIPISLLAAFLPMFFTGMTINMISLGGLALAVGMVVDNSIVVLENIFRHMQEKGEDRVTAARRGAGEVGIAITASSLTTIAVFVPIVFTTGLASRIFRDLALTVTFALLSALFVAVTLVPMMASKLLSVEDREKAKGGVFKRVRSAYKQVIAWVLDHKLITLGATNVLWISSIAILIVMGKEFMPTANDETFMVEIELPRGTRLEETDRISRRIEELILNTPEVASEHAVIGHSTSSDSLDSKGAFFIINLVDQSKRARTVEQVNDDIRKRVLQIPGIVKYNFVNLQSRSLGGSGAKPIEVKIFGKDLAVLSTLSQEAIRRMNEVEGLVDAEETFQFGNPELQIHFDRERMAQLGLDISRVARLMETAVKGTVASRYRELGEEFDIRVRLIEKERDSVVDLNSIGFTTPAGNQIHLSDIAIVEVGSGPVRIFRDDQKRSVSILANTLGRDLNSVVVDIKESVAAMSLPMGYYVEYGGSYEDMTESQVQLTLAFLLGALLVYMIIAAEFVNNGIVLIDYVNQLRADGMEVKEALIEAGATRLRPILMTTLTTILALVPMAVMGGAGSEMRRPLAISLIGGLAFGSALTLLIIPTAYYVYDSIAHRIYVMFMRIFHPTELIAGSGAGEPDMTKK
jgi:HAE1 family hydrophobic/amphiphilic exporter-1